MAYEPVDTQAFVIMLDYPLTVLTLEKGVFVVS
jgi:hypothetical protein